MSWGNTMNAFLDTNVIIGYIYSLDPLHTYGINAAPSNGPPIAAIPNTLPSSPNAFPRFIQRKCIPDKCICNRI